MKTRALVIFAVAGVAIAGCGGASKVRPHGPIERGGPVITLTAPTTTTIANPVTGKAMRCTYHGVAAGAHVPAASHGVTGSADGRSGSATLNLTRHSDGSLSVSCMP